LSKPLSDGDKLSEGFNQVEGQVDETAMLRNCADDVLANPPNGVGAEPGSASPIKLVNGSDKPQATFLHQVFKRHNRFLSELGRYAQNQPQVGFD
jgi:hypothetical protein